MKSNCKVVVNFDCTRDDYGGDSEGAGPGGPLCSKDKLGRASCRERPHSIILSEVTCLDKGTDMTATKAYTVSDGDMVLTLEPADEGGYVVTCPLDPELITEADSLDEAFQNARDAADALHESRKKLTAQLADAGQT